MTDRISAGGCSNRSVLPITVSRRTWILGTLLGSAGMSRRAWSASGKQGDLSQGELAEIAKVEAIARKSGIGPFTHGSTEHFIGLGDAPAAFRQAGMARAEAFTKAFLAYFGALGFKVELPPQRMTVMTLKNENSYQALIGRENPGMAVGGHYDIDTNRLVMFDLRNQQARLAVPAERLNSFTLVHETAHMLCFNTGVLSRQADVPACISEGLATYAELWDPNVKGSIGVRNRERFKALWDSEGNPQKWIPLAALLKIDDRFDDPDTEQVAYAESWLLAHFLLKRDAWRSKFQAYLAGLKDQPQGPAGRIKYAESQLGPLDVLDRDLRNYARQQGR
jgi:hypothetical protein